MYVPTVGLERLGKRVEACFTARDAVCKQISVTAGTILHGTRKPLSLWFRAMWHITNQKYGANALGLQRVLNLGSYHTAWQWLHKLRRAMVRPGRDKLSSIVEIDETYVGGKKKPGKRGRGAAGKALVGIAVEDKSVEGIGRIRLRHLEDASEGSLTSFVEGVAQAWQHYPHRRLGWIQQLTCLWISSCCCGFS